LVPPEVLVVLELLEVLGVPVVPEEPVVDPPEHPHAEVASVTHCASHLVEQQ
jgi:hypothetical protein